MKKLISFIIVFMLVSFPSQAEVVLLKQGDKAPYKGYLFDLAQEQKIRLDLEYFKELDKSKDRVIQLLRNNEDVMAQRISLYQKQNIDLNEQLASTRDVSVLERIAWFGLGVVATGFAFYGIKQINK